MLTGCSGNGFPYFSQVDFIILQFILFRGERCEQNFEKRVLPITSMSSFVVNIDKVNSPFKDINNCNAFQEL